MRRHGWLAASFVVALAAMVSAGACAAASPSAPAKSESFPIPQSMIETAVKNLARSVTDAANRGMSSTGYSALRPMAFRSGFGPGRRFSIIPVQISSIVVNEPLDLRINCSAGGYRHFVGSISGHINATGLSQLIMNGTWTIYDNRCFLYNDWVVNGDPYISDSGYISLSSNRVYLDFDETLGWKGKQDGTGKTISCQHKIEVLYDNITYGRVQGSVTCAPPTTVFSISFPF